MDHTVLPAITPMPASTSYAFTRWRLPRLRLRISNCSLLLIYLPRKGERLSRPGWLTYSGWFTHISGHPSAAGQAQDSESSPVKDSHTSFKVKWSKVRVRGGRGHTMSAKPGGHTACFTGVLYTVQWQPY